MNSGANSVLRIVYTLVSLSKEHGSTADLQAAGPVSPKTSPTAGHLRCVRSAPLSSRAGAVEEFWSPSSDTRTVHRLDPLRAHGRSSAFGSSLELIQCLNPNKNQLWDGCRTASFFSPLLCGGVGVGAKPRRHPTT